MKTIVFFCIPAYGHTNPTLNVVRELVNRGHRVFYYSYNSFRQIIEDTKATFISLDEYDLEHKLKPEDAARIGKDIAFSTRIIVDTTLSLNDRVLNDMQKIKPDCIVYDSMAYWGKAVAMKLNIPYVCSTTTFAFNRYSAKTMKQKPAEIFNFLFSMPETGRQIKRLKDKVYPIKNVLDLISNDENTPTVVYTSSLFQPYSETFNDSFAFVGPSIRPKTSDFIKKKEKLIYISMGTVNNNMIKLYRKMIEAFSDTDYQVLISIGNSTDRKALEPVPENIEIYNSVDQIAVLEKTDLFISHAGMNSVSESLYFGVPLILLPITAEQKAVATRVTQLSAGIILEDISIENITQKANELLINSSYKENALKISRSFHNCTGAKGAADKILSTIKS